MFTESTSVLLSECEEVTSRLESKPKFTFEPFTGKRSAPVSHRLSGSVRYALDEGGRHASSLAPMSYATTLLLITFDLFTRAMEP